MRICVSIGGYNLRERERNFMRITLSFEVDTVEEAIALMENIGDIVTITGDGGDDLVERLNPLKDKSVDEPTDAEAKPLSARERRLAGKNENKGGKKLGSPRKHGSKKSSERKATRSKATPHSKKAEPVSDEITDADLAKAASQGAEQIGPKLVIEILEQFSVGSVSELKGDQRKEFIDLVNSEME